MSSRNTKPRWISSCGDIIVILTISLAAEAGHFSVKQGQSLITGDSLQHVDAAEALLVGDRTPDFSLRKPGYTLVLAALGALTGNMSWSAVMLNHLLLALLPVAAYGLGRALFSRTAGWMGGVLLIAQLQVSTMGVRIMSEATYAALLTWGLLSLLGGLRSARGNALYLVAGMFLGGAWLVRAVAIAVIVGGLVVLAWCNRRSAKRATVACCLFMIPIFGAVGLECGLNYAASGRFRASTGGFGIMLLTRARFFQGSPLPDTPVSRELLALLPERNGETAFRVNHLDGCVAWCRARRDLHMDEWAFNEVAVRAGVESIAADVKKYCTSGASIFVRHVLRQRHGPPLAAIPLEEREPIIVHPSAAAFGESQDHWYAYWFLPHRSLEASVSLANEVTGASRQRAPFGRGEPWDTLRFLSMHPMTTDALGVVRSVASIWPGFALLLCAPLGLNRRACALLATVYVLEAALIAACGSTDMDNERYQYVWVGVDTALTSALIASVWSSIRASLSAAPAGVYPTRRSKYG